MTVDELREQIEHYGVHPLLGPVGLGWNIEQNPQELAIFLDAIPGVKTVLEIGTGPQAGLARYFTEVLGWKVTSIDHNGPFKPIPHVRLILADSADAYAQVENEHFDLVIIDADHRYEAIKRDYLLYAPLGHIVMLHDIVGLRDCEGAAQFWQEIAYAKNRKRRRGYYEAIVAGDQGAGIGWVVHE